MHVRKDEKKTNTSTGVLAHSIRTKSESLMENKMLADLRMLAKAFDQHIYIYICIDNSYTHVYMCVYLYLIGYLSFDKFSESKAQ